MKISRRRFTRIAAATTAATVAPMLATPAIGQGKTQLKMIHNWRYQGPKSWFFLAEDYGYFAKAGIDMIMDQGNSSGAAVGQVAGGAYDVGW